MITMKHAVTILDSLSAKPTGILKKRRRASQDQLEKAINSLTADLFDGVMVVMDPIKHKITKINDPYCVLSGGYGDSVLDQELAEIVPVNRRVPIKKLFERLFSTRDRRPAVEITIPFGINETTAENLRARVYCNEQSIVVLVDKAQLANLQEIEVIQIKGLISRSPDAGFWVTDLNGIIKDVSALNSSDHLGYRESDLIGMNIGTFIKNTGKTSLISRSAKPVSIERIAKDGSCIPTEVIQKKITMSNGSQYILHLDTYLNADPVR